MNEETKQFLEETRSWAQEGLAKALDFWTSHAFDDAHGGIYTCLTREGEIYSTDKSVWMQGRTGWLFSYLCQVYGESEEWMTKAKSCIDFLEAHCKNEQAANRLYFTVTEDGRPLRQRRYSFSECFYAMANAEYYGMTGEKDYLDRARWAYQLVYDLHHGLTDPTGMGPKVVPETRRGRALADPMIFLNMTGILRRVDPEHSEQYDAYARECVENIICFHVKEDLSCTLETVAPDGSFQKETTAGRVVNPGHDLELAWFLLEEALYLRDLEKSSGRIDESYNSQSLLPYTEKIYRNAIEAGWDETYGGILYFIDCLGYPPEAYEHDMKLWWPHNEALIASIMLYRETKDSYYLEWFKKVLAYSKEYFVDDEYGDWYGYLRRDGKPTEPIAKGNTFKGPFHVSRCLIEVDQTIKKILSEGN
jgi:N-acylglucosamine 2-epimerase